MNVINVHRRTIFESKDKISELLKTLSTEDDKIWPNRKWPAIRFNEGLKLGAKGGHGSIKYTIVTYDLENAIHFQFAKSSGFNGIHKFEIIPLEKDKTEMKHSIVMTTVGLSTFWWLFIIRWLHDALIEDALDKVENQFLSTKKQTKWSLWVRLWRYILK